MKEKMEVGGKKIFFFFSIFFFLGGNRIKKEFLFYSYTERETG